VGKAVAASGEEQRSSVGVNGSRWNVRPPSSERRSTQPPPTTSESGVISARSVRSAVTPVRRPAQVAPPSSVRSTAPKSPAA
jgi:hypothetical protein